MKIIAILFFVLISMPASAGSQMMLHKALYDVKLVSARNGAQISDIQGKMYFEWDRTCDAWVTDHRSYLTYLYTDGNAARITTDFVTYESLDGKQLTFTSKRSKDGVVYESYRGSVDLDNPDGAVVDYQEPEFIDEVRLPDGAYFPMNHTLTLLKKAAAGERFFHSVIFDGSDDTGPQDVNIFIGQSEQAPAVEGIDDDNLLGNRAWNLRLAFFPVNAEMAAADYEMDLLAHDNGVVSDVLIEYPDFSVSQILKAVEKIDEPECPSP